MQALLTTLSGAPPAPLVPGKPAAGNALGTGGDASASKSEAPGLFAAALAAASPRADGSVAGTALGAAGAQGGPRAGAPSGPVADAKASGDVKAKTEAKAETEAKESGGAKTESAPQLDPSLVGQIATAVPQFMGYLPTVAARASSDVGSGDHLTTPATVESAAAGPVAGLPPTGGDPSSPSTGRLAPDFGTTTPGPLNSSSPSSPAAPPPSNAGGAGLQAGLPAIPNGANAARSPASAEPRVREAAAGTANDSALAVLPSSSAFPLAAEAAAAAPDAPGTASPPGFSAQLAKPVFTLAAAGPGEHVMTVKVAPEDLGPVTVQAHIAADGVKVQLFAPTDVGRAAVQAALPELRRDLAAAGLGASLDLSARSAPQDGGGAGGRDSPGRGSGAPPGRAKVTGVGLDSLRPSARPSPALPGTDTRLDILA